MITKEKIKIGLKNGTIRIVESPNEDGTVCQIGENWFYFGGQTAEEMSPEEYLKNVPLEDIIREIYDALQDFLKQDENSVNEYLYYDAVLEEQSDKSREFYVNTPLGRLKVWAKQDIDNPEDYPGVFVDYIDKDGKDIRLCCTEYDSVNKAIYTHVYGNGNSDSPTDSIYHENLEQTDEQHFDREELGKLFQTLVDLSYKLPDEEDCTNVENDMCADICNLRESIQNYLEECDK